MWWRMIMYRGREGGKVCLKEVTGSSGIVRGWHGQRHVELIEVPCELVTDHVKKSCGQIILWR
jgi:hypothetical protein